MWTASFDKTALRVMPFETDLSNICPRTGMTPGEKFGGISLSFFGPWTGSHLGSQPGSPGGEPTYHLSPLSTFRLTQSDHTPGLAGPSHPASTQLSSAVCPLVIIVFSSNMKSLSSIGGGGPEARLRS
jgi:hypothetical protein